MRLTYLGIQHFGKLKEKELFPEDGINVIYGPNESGKSTLHAFIRGMLFGMTRSRGRGAKTDPYTRYEPWERPADYAGSMRFEAGGKEFRIDRNFYKGDIRENLVCETDGEQLSIAQGDLQMLLGGISEGIYDNTVSIAQLRSETDEGMVRELQNYMSNYENAGAGDVDVQRASEKLKKKKKEWQIRQQNLQSEHSRQLEQMESRIEYLRQEQEGLENQLEKVRAEQQEAKRRQAQAERKQEEEGKRSPEYQGYREERENRVKEQDEKTEERIKAGAELSVIALGCLCVLLTLWNPFSMNLLLWMILGGVGVLSVVFGVWRISRKASIQKERKKNLRKDPQKNLQKNGNADKDLQEKPEKMDSAEERKQQIIRIQEYISRLHGREETLLQQMEEKSTMVQNLQENRADFCGKTQEIRNCETEIQSLDLALAMMEKLSGGMRKKIGRRLQGRMEEILSGITDGKYGQISMDEDMKITLYEWNRPVALHQVSRGTVEQVYFALRMAVSEVLCEEQIPVLLDDVFAMYDEKRLAQTLRWLSKRGGQVLIFTCHKREQELLKKLGIKANIIEL